MSTPKIDLLRKIKVVMVEKNLAGHMTALSRELNARGIQPIKGGTWDESNPSKLRNFWTNNKGLLESDECDERASQESLPDESPLSDERASHDADTVQEPGGTLPDEHEGRAAHISEQAECDEHGEHDAHIPWTEIEERMKAIAREVATSVMNEMNVSHEMNVMNVNHEPGPDLPPEPEYRKGQKGRKQNRTYERLTVSLDANLAALFRAEMKRRKVSSGRMMDIVCWHYFGKPHLSFEDTNQADD